uniref:IS5 family transposase n=1 Tax=Aromatoleum buckelii TaxID=200254 RepID=A0ABX1N3Q1_9RHOO
MDRRMLSDTQWARIADLLPGKPTDKGGRAADNRRFVEAVLYLARTGCPWRDLPPELGKWHSVYVRFSRWEQYGVWDRVAQTLCGEADLEELFIDSTVVRAHQHSAGAPKKTGDQAIGRSRGGLSTKIHACVDALGNPLRLILTGGQVADVTQAAALIEAIATDAVIADKGYDSDAFIETIEASGAQAIIPPRRNRTSQRHVDWHRYKARNLVERFFNRLKQFRRLATRYDKLVHRFNAFLQLACAYIRLL